MTDSRIQELFDEVETYKQAIQDAGDALASAGQELDEELDARYHNEFERKESRNGGRRQAPSASGFPAKIGRNAYDG